MKKMETVTININNYENKIKALSNIMGNTEEAKKAARRSLEQSVIDWKADNSRDSIYDVIFADSYVEFKINT